MADFGLSSDYMNQVHTPPNSRYPLRAHTVASGVEGHNSSTSGPRRLLERFERGEFPAETRDTHLNVISIEGNLLRLAYYFIVPVLTRTSRYMYYM